MISSESKLRAVTFSISEDYYFATYTSFLLLKFLGVAPGRALGDHRQLAYLAEFVGSPIATLALVRVLPSEADQIILRNAYARGLSRAPILNRLILAWEQAGLIESERRRDDPLARSLVIPDAANKRLAFLDAAIFLQEQKNILRITRKMVRLRRQTLPKLLSTCFVERGIETWGL
jgi:hypothetical protein